jgi:hypothetical protein
MANYAISTHPVLTGICKHECLHTQEYFPHVVLFAGVDSKCVCLCMPKPHTPNVLCVLSLLYVFSKHSPGGDAGLPRE